MEAAFATSCDLTDESFNEVGLNWKDGKHGNELETSLMLALRPGLVKLDLAGTGIESGLKFFRVESVNFFVGCTSRSGFQP